MTALRFPPTCVGRIYARLSQTRGNSDDVSIERQLADGHEWFDAQGIRQVAVYVEPKGHRSGGSITNRPEYRRMMAEIQPGDVLWCNDQARFTRAEDYMSVLDGLRKRNITVVFHREVVNLADYSSRMVVRARGFGNAIYREMVSEAQTKAYADFRKAGAYYSKKHPLGMTSVGKGMSRRLCISDEGVYWINNQMVVGKRDAPPTSGEFIFRGFFDTVTEFFKVYVFRDMGSRLATHYLNEQGYRGRGNNGLPVLIDQFTLVRILRYTHHYRGFIDDALLDAVKRETENNTAFGRRGRKPSTARPVLLRRMLFCEHCGSRYTTAVNYRQYREKRTYLSYVHSHKACKLTRQWSATKVDEWFWETLKPLFRLTPAEITRMAEVSSNHDEKSLKVEIQRLEEKLSRLEEAWIDGTIRQETYRKKVGELTSQLEQKRQYVAPVSRLSTKQRIELMTNLVSVMRESSNELDLVVPILKQMIDKVYLSAEGTIRIVPQKDFREFFMS